MEAKQYLELFAHLFIYSFIYCLQLLYKKQGNHIKTYFSLKYAEMQRPKDLYKEVVNHNCYYRKKKSRQDHLTNLNVS